MLHLVGGLSQSVSFCPLRLGSSAFPLLSYQPPLVGSLHLGLVLRRLLLLAAAAAAASRRSRFHCSAASRRPTTPAKPTLLGSFVGLVTFRAGYFCRALICAIFARTSKRIKLHYESSRVRALTSLGASGLPQRAILSYTSNDYLNLLSARPTSDSGLRSRESLRCWLIVFRKIEGTDCLSFTVSSSIGNNSLLPQAPDRRQEIHIQLASYIRFLNQA